MHVMLNGVSSQSGGAITYLNNMVPLLQLEFARSNGEHQLTLLLHETQKINIIEDRMPAIVWISGGRMSAVIKHLWLHRKIKKIAKELKVDVLFTPYQIGPRIDGVLQVLMFRNMEPFCFRRYRYSVKCFIRNYALYLASLYSLRKADRVIAVSGYVEQNLHRNIGNSRNTTRLIYHGRDTRFSEKKNQARSRMELDSIGVRGQFVLTCGSILPYRRCEDVILAFAKSIRELPDDTVLVIAGSGNDKAYEKKINRLISDTGIKDRIVLAGHVPKPLLFSLYHNCTVCVMATEIEACPNILIEAMSSGCVIIGSNIPPIPEISKDSILTYESRDIADLSEKIVSVFQSNDLKLELRSKALRRSLDFSWQDCAAQTYAALVNWDG